MKFIPNHHAFLFLSASFFTILTAFLIVKTFWNLSLSYRKNKSTQLHLPQVERLRPFTFFKFFANALSISFFPQFILRITQASGMHEVATSILFITYQITFLIMLIPGGYLVEIKNIKLLLIISTLIEAIILISLGFTHQFWLLLVLQIVFGLVVPISTSSEYAYLFGSSTDKNRTFAISLYTNTLRGAMIAGIFTGGVLATWLNDRAVFFISGGMAILATLYAFIMLANIKPAKELARKSPKNPYNFAYAVKNIPTIFKSLKFTKIIFLIAIPSGFLYEGIILFSLPLILSHYNFAHVDIAQIMVLFAIGFFATNKRISKDSDNKQNEFLYLFLGLIGISGALALLSFLHIKDLIGINIHYFNIAALVISIILLGMFQGFIMSTSMASISKNKITKRIGKNVAFSVYKLAESLGKIAGPIIIANLLIMMNYSPRTYLIIAGFYLICAIIFVRIPGLQRQSKRQDLKSRKR